MLDPATAHRGDACLSRRDVLARGTRVYRISSGLDQVPLVITAKHLRDRAILGGEKWTPRGGTTAHDAWERRTQTKCQRTWGFVERAAGMVAWDGEGSCPWTIPDRFPDCDDPSGAAVAGARPDGLGQTRASPARSVNPGEASRVSTSGPGFPGALRIEPTDTARDDAIRVLPPGVHLDRGIVVPLSILPLARAVIRRRPSGGRISS